MYHLLSSSLFLALLLGETTAVPAPKSGSHDKVHRLSTNSVRIKNGLAAIDKAYGRYKWEKPLGLIEAAAASKKIAVPSGGAAPATNNNGYSGGSGSAVGTVTATPKTHDSEYLCPVVVGGQTLQLNFDTGSSNLWVFNTAISPASDQEGHNIYDPSKSSTHVEKPGLTFSAFYGDKSTLGGSVESETVEIGSISVTGQPLELPTSVSSSVKTDPADGILGLGFQSMNSISENNGRTPYPQPTFFEQALPKLLHPLFTANLKYGTSGYYQFGNIDATAYKGELSYTPVQNNTGYWGMESTSFAVGGGAKQTNSSANMAVADTGTSLFFVDPQVFSAYYENIDISTDQTTGMTIYNCNIALPDFQVALGDYMASIPGASMKWAEDGSNGMCIGGIQSNNGQGPQVYGDILFGYHFAVFDYGNMRLGFAPHA